MEDTNNILFDIYPSAYSVSGLHVAVCISTQVKSGLPNKVKYTLAVWYLMFYFCLYLQCHDKQQDVKLRTVTKDYTVLTIWGKRLGGENGEGDTRRGRSNLYLQNCVMEDNK